VTTIATAVPTAEPVRQIDADCAVVTLYPYGSERLTADVLKRIPAEIADANL